jgi:uncharacterized protein YndB with AHSA1/START domain
MNTDRIEKQIVLQATLERVWRAISESARFGAWFGVEFDGPFVAGTKVSGRIVPTQVDPVVAKLQEPHRGHPFHMTIDQIEPMRLLAFRWNPGVEADPDGAETPTTTVTFELSNVDGGTLLTITESGFDQFPLDRRAELFKGNDEGWSHQSNLIRKYVSMPESIEPSSAS